MPQDGLRPGRPARASLPGAGLNDVVLNAWSLVCTPAAGPHRTLHDTRLSGRSGNWCGWRARPGPDRRRGREGSTTADRSTPTAGRQLQQKDPRPIREGVDDGSPFDAKGRRLLLGKGPVSRFLKCVQKSMSSGHGAGSGRSTREAGAPRFPETARAAHCRQPWYGRSQVGIRKTTPGTFGTTLTSGHRARSCTPRSMLGR